MNREDVKRVMACVQILWPHSPLYPTGQATLAVDVWFTLIGDLDRDATLACVQALATDGREHAPAVGTIRQRTVETLAQISGEAIPSAGEAWGEVQRALGSVGREGIPVWSHTTVFETVRAFGWVNLCANTNAGVAEAQFRKTYEIIATRKRQSQVMPESVRDVLAKVGRGTIGEGDARGTGNSVLTVASDVLVEGTSQEPERGEP